MFYLRRHRPAFRVPSRQPMPFRKPHVHRTLRATLAAALLALALPGAASALEYVPDEVVVRYEPGTDDERARGRAAQERRRRAGADRHARHARREDPRRRERPADGRRAAPRSARGVRAAEPHRPHGVRAARSRQPQRRLRRLAHAAVELPPLRRRQRAGGLGQRARGGRPRRPGTGRRRDRHRRRLPQLPQPPALAGLPRAPVRHGLRLRRRRLDPVRPQRARHSRGRHDRRADRQRRVRRHGPGLQRAPDAGPGPRRERRGQHVRRRARYPLRGQARREADQHEPGVRDRGAGVPDPGCHVRAALRVAQAGVRRRGGRQRGRHGDRVPCPRAARRRGRRHHRAPLSRGLLEPGPRARHHGAGRRPGRVRRGRDEPAVPARTTTTARRSAR